MRKLVSNMSGSACAILKLKAFHFISVPYGDTMVDDTAWLIFNKKNNLDIMQQCCIVDDGSYHSGQSHFLAETAMMMMRMVRTMAPATRR